MGVPALLGRASQETDVATPAAPPRIAAISYLFWQRHFHGSQQVVGHTLELNHQLYSIVGVLPARFTWTDADVYIPLPMVASQVPLNIILRLKPGVTTTAFDAEAQALTTRFAKRSPAHTYPPEFRFASQRLNDWLLGKFKGTLLILMAAVAFLLLIACGNVSILLLARAGERQREIATRLSLGASRSRILRQLLTESVILSILGGIIGVLLAYRGVPAIVSLMPEYSVPHEAVIQVNSMVVLFTFVTSVLTGILFGMAPAVQLTQLDLRDPLQEGSRSSTGSSVVGRTRNLLVVAEIALTMILLVGAGVALRGFWALVQRPLGFQPDRVLMLYLNTQSANLKTWEARKAFYDKVLTTFRETPGILSATATVAAIPPWTGFKTSAELPNGSGKELTQPVVVGAIAGDYFKTLGITLLSGRLLAPSDLQNTTPVAIINDELQRQDFPAGQNPIGEKIRLPELDFSGNPFVFTAPSRPQTFEIIGVVATALNRGLQDKALPGVYVPLGAILPPTCGFLVKTKGDPNSMINPLREQMRKINPDQPLSEIRTIEDNITRQSLAYPLFSTILFSLFAGVALLLAVAGIYSVISYVVTRRTREFGIRIALGARDWDVLALVGGTTARLMLLGIVIGFAGSLALSHWIATYVESWNPSDPIAFLAVATLLLAAAAAACYLPASRALRIQPMTALRHE